ncbi:MAG: hypothetical protein ABI855_00375 [Bacteroidota bacterium]
MDKEQFINQKDVLDFVDWINQFWNKRELFFKTKIEYKNLEEAFNEYHWKKDESFNQTFEKFKQLNEIISTCLNPNETEKLKKIITEEVLNWGGVKRGNIKHLNSSDLVERIKNIKTYLKEVDKTGEFPKSNGTKFISTSGFSKIFSAINNRFVIYDTRVAYAMCLFIKKYCEEKKLGELPDSLKLYHGGGSTKADRNPNEKGSKYQFPCYSGRHYVHFLSLVKTKWILELLSNKREFKREDDRIENMWRWQSALFMVGE